MQNVVNAGFAPERRGPDPKPSTCPTATGPIDFAFLAAQTFDDIELQRNVLELFVTQVRRVIPSLPGMTARDQADAAHLLVGSARGIGAREAAAAAEAYAAAADRTAISGRLVATFAAATEAIEAHLAAAGS